jgi:senataxin
VGGQQVVYEDPFRDKPTFIANAVWDDLCRTHNPSQLQAVRYVCAPLTSTSDTRVALIQGPPGCGKSHCVVGMVSGLLSRTSGTAAQKKKILLCTPSNAACDELLRRLVSEGVADMQVPGLRRRVALVRLGENLEQAPREVQDLMLENQVEALLQRTQLYTQWSNVRDQFRDSLALVGRLNREAQQLGGQKAEPAEHYKERREAKGQHEYNLRQLTSLEVLIDQKRNELRRAVLDGAEVVASTLSSAGKQNFLEWLLLNKVTFDTVIVDEAAQASEPSSARAASPALLSISSAIRASMVCAAMIRQAVTGWS